MAARESGASSLPAPLPGERLAGRLGQAAERLAECFASGALVLMLLLPLVEIAVRPLLGEGIQNQPLLVQHLGLILAMAGAVLAERGGHLTTLGPGLAALPQPWLRTCAGWAGGAGSGVLQRGEGG